MDISASTIRAGVFACTDMLRCRGRRRLARYLHLISDVDVTVGARSARLSRRGRAASVCWEELSALSIDDGLISRNYGLAETAPILVLSDTIHGDTELRFAIPGDGEVK